MNVQEFMQRQLNNSKEYLTMLEEKVKVVYSKNLEEEILIQNPG